MADLSWNGLEELRTQLRNLPADLTAEASRLVDGAAEAAAREIKAAYPVRTGKLRDGVIVTHVDQGKYSAGAIVKNTAPHAWLFEHGTQARHTDLGANRGSMPPGHVFLPVILRQRRQMYAQLKALLERAGAIVSGEP